MTAAAAPLGIALLGVGHVGAAVLRRLVARAPALAAAAGGPLALRAVAARQWQGRALATADGCEALTDPVAAATRADVAIVVELLGGTGVAGDAVRAALAAGKAVVTANKALLAAHPELAAAAARAGTPLRWEAAVAGAIPVVGALQTALAGDRIDRVVGIVNGTCNYILTEMEARGLPLDAAIAEAQAHGYAEADPSADVDGHDAAAKLALLARLAFGALATPADVATRGIGGVRLADLRRAGELGLCVRLLALAVRHGAGAEARLDLRVQPTLLRRDHPLAAVRGARNAVWIEAEAAGPVMLYGQGAGGDATSSAVLGDIVAVARDLRRGGAPVPPPPLTRLVPLPASERSERAHIACVVRDAPGVLAAIAGALAAHGVSVESCVQHGRAATAPVELVFVTHPAPAPALQGALTAISSLDAVFEVASHLPVWAEEAPA